jgi:hypothetical protein
MARRRWIYLSIDWDRGEWSDDLTGDVIRLWLDLVCYVAKEGVVGRVRRPSDEFLTQEWGTTEQDIAALERATIGARMLVLDGGDWVVTEWVQNYSRPPRGKRHYGWERIRREILERDGGVCTYCGEPANSVDHVVPSSRGGTNDPDNLKAACMDCNRRKNAYTPEEWRAR